MVDRGASTDFGRPKRGSRSLTAPRGSVALHELVPQHFSVENLAFATIGRPGRALLIRVPGVF